MSQFSEMDKRSRKETEKKRGRCASDFPYPSLTAVRSPTSTQTLKPLSGERLWRNLPSIFLILHDFDYLPRFFSVSAALNVALATLLPVPESLAVTVNQREGYHQQWDRPRTETMRRFFELYPEYANFQAPPDRFSWGWYYAAQHLGDEEATASSAGFRAKLEQRQQWMRRLAWVAPAINAQAAFNQITQTDLANHLAYLDSVRGYHEAARRFFYPFLMRDGEPPPVNWERLPRHQFHDEKQTVSFPLSSLSLLAISAGLILLAGRRMRRASAA